MSKSGAEKKSKIRFFEAFASWRKKPPETCPRYAELFGGNKRGNFYEIPTKSAIQVCESARSWLDLGQFLKKRSFVQSARGQSPADVND